MASLLRFGSVTKIFTGFRRILTAQTQRYEGVALHRPQSHSLCTTVTRLLSAQRPAESSSTSHSPSQGIDRALYRIDTDIRRTGRIFLRDVEDIYNEIKTLRHASSTQSLLLLRCCGSLVPEEKPEVRTKLVHDIWNTLQDLKVPLDISHYNTLLRVYLENNYKFSPTEFLAQLEKNSVEPNRVTYQRLIARYCQEGDIEGSTKILEFMKEKQLPVGENIFNALITGHARAKDFSSAWTVLDVMRSSGLEPTSDSYAALLVVHAESGDAEGLQRTFQECEAAELTLHDRDILEAVFALATHDHLGLIPQVLEKLHRHQGYVHDAMNIIYRLVNAGCHKTAHQVFATMRVPQISEGQLQAPYPGSFFIRHLVKSSTTPMTQVVEYCQELREKGHNPLALEIALNSALIHGRSEEALFLMRVMQDEGCVLRTHYFWPIFLHHSKNGNAQKVYDTAKEMVNFDIPVTLETLRHYVIPGLASQEQLDTEGLIAGLKEAGIPVPLIVNGLVAFLLDTSSTLEAAKLLSRYRVRVRSSLRKDLADRYVESGHVSAVVAILGQILTSPKMSANTQREDTATQKDDEEDNSSINREEQQENQDTAAMFLLDVAFQSQRRHKQEKLLTLLQEMEQRGIAISAASRDAIKARLPFKLDAASEEILDRVCSGSLTFQPLPREPQEPYSQRSVKDLEQRVLELKNKNLPTASVEVFLLMAYMRAKEVEKAESLLQHLETEGVSLGTGAYVLLIDMYVGMNDLKKAVATLQKLKTQEPEARLTPTKYMRLALLMAQHGMREDMIQLIEQHLEQEGGGNSGEDLILLVGHARRLLEEITEQFGMEHGQHVLDLLLTHKVVPPTSSLFNPFIKVHLAKGDLVAALTEFESICQTHRCTPCKQELITHCIKLEDGERLQKIMDLSIQVHGELNSLYDMVFAFVECGKVHQARKLIETPGLRALNGKLDQKCKWLRDTNKIEELANLVSVTKQVFDVDCDMMYSHLLKAYVQQNDPDKALGVWTTMQEDDHRPSDDFLIELGQFLQSCGRQVPFVLPEKPLTQQQEQEQKLSSGGTNISLRAQYRRSVRDKDWTCALNYKNQMEESGTYLNVTECSELVEGLVRDGHLKEAANIVLSMAAGDAHPVPRVFKYFLMALAKAGQVEPMQALERYISNLDLKRRLNYDNLLCTAYTAAGRPQDMLEMLSKAIRDTPDTNLQQLEQNFPRGGIMGILEKHPDSFPQVLEIAEQYAARGLVAPINCVWMHLFSMGQQNQADQIYQKHLKNSDSMFMFRGVLNHAKKTHDVSHLSSLIQILEGHPNVSSLAKGLVYSTWINILSDNEKFEEGQQVLETALTKLTLTDLSPASLSRLKEGLENAGKDFPYIIPSKNNIEQRQGAKNSRSSSSSDSD